MTTINAPNLLSICRVLLVPFIIYFYVYKIEGLEFLAAILFILASITDWLDGYIARKFHTSSELGSVLDLLADKILVLVTLFFIVAENSDIFLTILGSLILIREIIILSVRSVYGQKQLRVIYLGKVKTFLQMFAIALLLMIDSKYEIGLLVLAEVVLILSVIISFQSLWAYLKKLK